MEFNAERYSNTLEYPNATDAEYAAEIKNIDAIPLTAAERNILYAKSKEKKQKRYNEKLTIYRNETARLRKLFEDDAEDFYAFEGLPKEVKAKIHESAWERGHSGGYYEVWNQYDSIVQLVTLGYHYGRLSTK